MQTSGGKANGSELNQKLGSSGFRFTPQRQQVYNVLLQKADHPTAEAVFIRAKQRMPDISMATVYNCLDALVKCGLLKQVNLDRTATRYCPNMTEHVHFYCEACARVYDIEGGLPDLQKAGLRLPRGFKPDHLDLCIRGTCPACPGQKT
jgi:Fur family peroxide stress response transcriptional regulator